MDITQAWMVGVVAAMSVFGGFALVGYFLRRVRELRTNIEIEKDRS